MIKDLKILCKLQKLDDKIFKIKKQVKRLPKELKELEEKHNLNQKAIKSINQKLEDNLQIQKNFEHDISANLQEINKYENQLLIVKTNKEYKALNSEITFRKERNAGVEEKLIELLEEESVLKKEKNNLENSLEKIKKS